MEASKVQAVLCNQRQLEQVYKFGPFLLDTAVRRLFLDGQVVPLTAKLFDILLLLVQRSGHVVTKDELMKEIWPGQFVEENNLTVSMSALRKALGERYGERKYIETVPKRGYRFVARIRELPITDTDYLEHHFGAHEREKYEAYSEVVNNSLAVLPLINETHNPELEYLSDGLAESIINSLSQIPQLRVLARSIVFRYKRKNLDIQRIGQELNVRAILAGRVLQFDDRLCINIELIDIEQGTQLWGEKYNCQVSNILEVQEGIATAVSEKLRFRLNHQEKDGLIKRHTEDATAYRLYLKGRFFWNKRSVKGIKSAIVYFQQAIDRDVDYSLAYTGLADCYSTLAGYGVFPAYDFIPKAKAALTRALEINELLAEAHTSLANIGMLYDLNWAEAEKEYEKAISLNPNYATAHQWYADHLAKLGRFDEAIERIKHALEIEPLSLIFNKTLGKILYFAREYDQAMMQCMEMLEIEPGFGPANGLLAYIYIAKQRYEEAIAEILRLINFAKGDYEVSPGEDLRSANLKKPLVFSQSDPEAIAALGYIYALIGRTEEALEIAEGLEELSGYRYVEPHTLAMVYIGLGDHDRAFKWLEKSFADRSSIITHLKVWHWLDPLRSDHRFVDLYRRVGFPQ
jgi:TolB-like protein/Flp pilus assembly protein TadD